MNDADSEGADAAIEDGASQDGTTQDATSPDATSLDATWDGAEAGGAGDAAIGCPPTEMECGGACVDEQTDPNNCGDCLHSCQGGPCTGGSCQPFVFFSGLGEPESIVHDSTRVYWANATDDRTIMSCLSGSTCETPATLASFTGPAYSQYLAVDGQNVYFGAAPGTSQTYQCPLGGCNGTPLDLGPQSGQIAVDSSNVYWLPYDETQLFSCSIGGCGGTPTVLAMPASSTALVADSTHLYWADRSKVASCVSDDCAATITILAPASAVFSMAVDANNLYWIEASSGNVYQCALGGCAGSPTLLAPGPSGAAVMVVDGEDVYWVNDNPSSLVRCAVGGCGGSPTVLATSQGSPAGLTIDAKSIFWTDRLAGVIMKLAK